MQAGLNPRSWKLVVVELVTFAQCPGFWGFYGSHVNVSVKGNVILGVMGVLHCPHIEEELTK